MYYFGINIFDGKIYSEFPLELNVSLEDQRFQLGSDIGMIEYEFRGFGFCIDIGWRGGIDEVSSGNFYIRIYEGPRTLGKNFLYCRIPPDLIDLKKNIKDAVAFVQELKLLTDEQILEYTEAKR